VKKMIIGAIVLIVLFVLVLNSSILADQAVQWAKNNPKDPQAADVLYKAGRWCDILGNDDKAVEIYWYLYQTYPERADLCAPALYYCAYIKDNGSNIPALRKQAQPYLDVLLNQYAAQDDWGTKGKKIQDEVNNVH
jgi:hypothetical protein